MASSKVMSSAAAGPLAEDLSPAEAVGVLRSLVANVPGATYRVALAVRHSDATRRSLTIEYRIVRADGAVRWVLERGTTGAPEARPHRGGPGPA